MLYMAAACKPNGPCQAMLLVVHSQTAHFCCRPRPAVKISSPSTGISLEVATTSPGLQFYSGGLLSVDAPVIGKGGTQYPRFGGFAVETQVRGSALVCSAVSKQPVTAYLPVFGVLQSCAG